MEIVYYFLNKNETNYKNIRNYIYQEGKNRKSSIPNLMIDTERGKIYI